MAKGAQITWTPWRSHRELLQVRSALYGHNPTPGSAPAATSPEEDEERDLRRQACDLISAWKHRAPLPHALESTWLLTEAALADSIPTAPLFAVKASYVTAISRFVTALLDPLQPPLHKRSMYTLAQSINLPAVFVDIRHDGAHGEMPSLDKLRDASARALRWLWDHYWAGLEGETGAVGDDWKLGTAGRERDVDEVGEGGEEGGSQPGEWMVWEGPWMRRPIGVVP